MTMAAIIPAAEILGPPALRAVAASADALTAAFAATKAEHDVEKLAAADRAAMLEILKQQAVFLKEFTAYVMSHPQPPHPEDTP